MHGLRTSSVLILDDKDSDALTIQKALAKDGIGAVLVPGAAGQPRPQGLRGIRVAVLDIHLLDIVTDATASVRHTANVVNDLIASDNGPYVAVVWTQETEDFRQFEEELRKIACPPISAVSLDKALVRDLGVEACADKILDAVSSEVGRSHPLGFANLWEQIVSDAANDTVVSLGLAKDPGADSWRAMDRLAALLGTEADSGALQDDRASSRALVAALNPVHFDGVGNRSADAVEDLAAAAAPIRAHANAGSGGLALAEQARLNAALMFDREADGFGPGRLYRYGAIKDLGLALPDEQEIREGTAEDGHIGRAGDLPAIFLEVSAECDHQQGKVRVARLIGGVVFAASTYGTKTRDGKVPSKKRVRARTAGYLWPLDPVRVEDVEGFPADEVCIVWNAHYPVSVPVGHISRCEPFGRLRAPVLADIRAWLGYHAGRPGYASIR